ncbi:MAG: TrkH family potassium uptake protein [Gammaproteobacteria bacterium]
MQIGLVIRTLGVLFLAFSTTLVPPAIVALLYNDKHFGHFSATFAIAAVVGVALWLPFRGKSYAMHTRDGFGIVALMWISMSLLGSLPFMLGLDLPLVDALFESASGYTTTGSTILVGLDAMDPSILLYRQEIQWVGGIGVIVLAVAMLPMLGIGGMQLYRAETPGPLKDERITPRIAHTARRLAVLYAGMTAVCAACFWLAGMNAFEAVAHSLTTLSTGGYSTHDASLGFFDNASVETVAIVFMLVGGISFNVHFVVWRSLKFSSYLKNDQVRAFLIVSLVLSVLVAVVLLLTGEEQGIWASLRFGTFEVVSVITSTGFGVADFSLWPAALPIILIFASFMGGCAGSTAGGMKVIRFLILARQAGVYIERLIHPRLVRPVRLDGRVVEPSVVDGIWAFFTVYVVVFGILMILLMMNGTDQVTAFGAVATCLNNLGPGLGDVAANFTSVDAVTKVVLVVAMILGRLEIFTILVLLSPSLWRS